MYNKKKKMDGSNQALESNTLNDLEFHGWLESWRSLSRENRRLLIYPLYNLECAAKYMSIVDVALDDGTEFDDQGNPSDLLAGCLNLAMKKSFEDHLSQVPKFMQIYSKQEYKEKEFSNVRDMLKQHKENVTGGSKNDDFEGLDIDEDELSTKDQYAAEIQQQHLASGIQCMKDGSEEVRQKSEIEKELEKLLDEALEEAENEVAEDLEATRPTSLGCKCCRGRVFKCSGSLCKRNGICFCTKEIRIKHQQHLKYDAMTCQDPTYVHEIEERENQLFGDCFPYGTEPLRDQNVVDIIGTGADDEDATFNVIAGISELSQYTTNLDKWAGSMVIAEIVMEKFGGADTKKNIDGK